MEKRVSRKPKLSIEIAGSDTPAPGNLGWYGMNCDYTLHASLSVSFSAPENGPIFDEAVERAYRIAISNLFSPMLSSLDEVALAMIEEDYPKAIGLIRDIQGSVFESSFRDKYMSRFKIIRSY